jgi:Uma2 family endonuclease
MGRCMQCRINRPASTRQLHRLRQQELRRAPAAGVKLGDNRGEETYAVSTGTFVTLSEYLATSYRPDCEYLDGGLLERNVGEWDHSRLQMLLSHYLFSREKKWGIIVVPEQRVQVKATRFRVPDISVLTGPPPDGGIIVEPPFLCIEILSPSDRMKEMQERIDDYLNFGVRYVWLLHPRTRRAFVYTLDAVQEVKDGILRTEDPDMCVPLAELD